MTLRNVVAAAALVIVATAPLPASAEVPPNLSAIVAAWLASPHAKRDAEAFTHWNEEGAVEVECARCHSGPGFIDFVGADGSAAGVVDHPAATGAPVDCATCHNPAAMALESITFPSGVTVAGLGASSVCTVCHQGRESGDSVAAALAGMEEDAVSADLAFINVHYRAAAATLLGGAVRGGYQYDGKTYVERFVHPAPLDSCTGCHNPHSLEVAMTSCVACHKTSETIAAIRTGTADLDGDGDVTEGVAGEIATLHERLGQGIAAYAAEVAGAPIVYEPNVYPYFFNDTDADGAVGAGEAVFPNRYASWTPRLLRAAYNYQFLAKDPGAFAHNPRYATQITYDGLEDLSRKVDIDMGGMTRP